MALQIRRGTDTQRQALSGPNTPIAGELLYSTDNKKLHIGDGTTTGGTSIGYFGSVAVSGQSTIKSTGANEALTIVAGANISLTTNANTGTLTIAAAPQELTNGSLRLFQNNLSSINSNENINIVPSGTGQVNITSSLIVTGGVTTSLIRTTESKITLGLEAGQTSQGNFTVAVGYGAGKTSQGQNSVAIGVDSGKISQLYDSIAVGYGAGFRNQGNYAVALGASAGRVGQGQAAVAIGGGAGGTGDVNGLTGGQGAFAVAIGYNSALGDQGSYAVAIGTNSGNGQGVNAVAIGVNAGAEQQGANSVAIGSYAGQTSQPARTIIINAQQGTPVNGVAAQTDSFYVAPIRSATGTSGVLQYNSTTKEVSYNNTVSVSSVTSTSVTSTSVTSGSLNVSGIFSNQNISIDENRIRSLNSNQSIFLDPAGTGIVDVNANLTTTGLQIFGPGTGGTSGDGTILILNQNSATVPLTVIDVHSTASSSSAINFGRARGSIGTQTTVQNNDSIHQIIFTGHDGTTFRLSSSIVATVDGAVSSNVVPGKLAFTTTNSAGTSATRLTISSTAVTSTVPISNGSLQLFQNNLNGLNSNEDIVINPSGTGKLQVLGDLNVTGALKLAVYADATARDAAVTSPTAGMVVFNTTGTKFQGYTGSAWVDLN